MSHTNTQSNPSAATAANSFFEQFKQNNKFSLEPLMEFNNITTRLYSEIARQNLQTFNVMMQSSAKQMQRLSHVRGFEDAMNAHASFVNDITPTAHEHGQQVLETLLQSAAEYSQLMEKGVQEFSEKAKNVQEKAEKAGKTILQQAK